MEPREPVPTPEEATELLIKRVRRLSRALTQCDADVEDVEQELRIRLLMNPGFSPHGPSALAFVRVAAKSVLTDRFRSEAARLRRERAAGRSEVEQPTTDRIERADMWTLVRHILSQRQFEIVSRHVHGESFEKIAGLLSVSLATVSGEWRLATKILRANPALRIFGPGSRGD